MIPDQPKPQVQQVPDIVETQKQVVASTTAPETTALAANNVLKTSIKQANPNQTEFKGISLAQNLDGKGLKFLEPVKPRKVQFDL